MLHGRGNDIFDGAAESDPPYAPAQTPDGAFLVAGRTTSADRRQLVPRMFDVPPTERRQGVTMAGALYGTGGALAR